MRTILKSAASVSLLTLLLAITGCHVMEPAQTSGAGYYDGAIHVPLVFKPTDDLSGNLSLPTGSAGVFVKPVTDHQGNGSTLGQNTEDNPIPVIASTGTPADFVHDGIITELQKAGINTVDSASSADRVLDISLKNFTVNEGSTYKAEIRAVVKVLDPSGTVLYFKSVGGENSTFGKSKNPDNYQQVLSNAVVDMTSQLLGGSDFTKAISK